MVRSLSTYILRAPELLRGCDRSLDTPRNPDIETTRRINVDYTMATANTFKSFGSEPTPFRFVYVSGLMVEKDQEKNLWFGSAPRKIRVCVSPSPLAHPHESLLTDGIGRDRTPPRSPSGEFEQDLRDIRHETRVYIQHGEYGACAAEKSGEGVEGG